ncbi:MAG TPA: hypothetical protein VN688_31945 [Gemmataceae bacterium]|nr:hypothetical protein [Gemmataceae bacterium]
MSRNEDNPDREQRPAFGEDRFPADSEDDLSEWLREHPEAHGDMADLQRMRELYQSVSVPQPEEAAWTATLTRIASGSRLRVKPALRRKRLGAILSLTAAAALVAVLLARSWWTGQSSTQPQPQLAEEVFPVVEADDVTIISMDARDVAALVVGEPPISGDLEFVQAADIRVIKCQRCPKCGNVPRLAQGAVPMVVTSVARVDEPEE